MLVTVVHVAFSTTYAQALSNTTGKTHVLRRLTEAMAAV